MAESDSAGILWEASFNRRVRTYWLWSGALVLIATVVGIVLLPIWFALGYALTERYLQHMRCTLTERTLRVSKGMFVRTEKTLPLDKITDLGVVHGPIMRYFGLQALSVETAGQSSPGALVRLVGIEDTTKFREAVLAQREKVVAAQTAGAQLTPGLVPTPDAGGSDRVLKEIRDAVLRIDERLGK